MPEKSNISQLEQRIADLEATFAHHQQEYDTLNQVVIEQNAEIKQLKQRLHRFEAMVQEVRQRLPDDRDFDEERPPHY